MDKPSKQDAIDKVWTDESVTDIHGQRFGEMLRTVASKPTPAQISALRLAQKEAIRYYKGGWYSIPAMYGPHQNTPQVSEECAKNGTLATNSVSPSTLRACEERGWLSERHRDECDGHSGPIVYCLRWTITDAGRTVLAAQGGTL